MGVEKLISHNLQRALGLIKSLEKTWLFGRGAVLLFVGVLPKGETPVISSDYAAS
ncbi:Hypothetical protein CulFRC11_0437 [Corynebacterium ramonii]|uniref:Uncharacterized protein n=1 Tax=Corynebacterium ramonii TaxID=3026968 RepID=A0ABM5RPZ9_9CORY|nr:Hypothetical protein CulFRC11_0437 [Corynebacterium ramonii FRC0011]